MTLPTLENRVKLKEVIKITGLSRFQILKTMEEGRFPACWEPSERGRFWDRAEVEAHMATTRFMPEADRVREAAAARDELYQVKLELEQAQRAVDERKEELTKLGGITPEEAAAHLREGAGPAPVAESDEAPEKPKKGAGPDPVAEAQQRFQSSYYIDPKDIHKGARKKKKS